LQPTQTSHYPRIKHSFGSYIEDQQMFTVPKIFAAIFGDALRKRFKRLPIAIRLLRPAS
jgi:hypothetical protein